MPRRSTGGKPDFWQFARDYLHGYCPHARRMSAKTIEAYRIGLEGFIAYLVSIGTVRQLVSFDCLDPVTVKNYSAWMTITKGYSPKTVDLRLTVLKSFLKYAAWQDVELMALHDQVAAIKPPKAPKKPVEHLAPAATAAILAAWDGATAKARRNRMILILLYDSAARVSEITGATMADLHLAKPAFISLRGKGGKTRNMPLMDKTVEHLRVYQAEFHPNRQNLSTPLFYHRRAGQPVALSTDSVALIVKQAADRVRHACPEVPARVHCHLLRTTRAMDLYTDGVPLPLIMQMLGHESMSTTSTFYAFATTKMMTDAITAANPQAIGPTPNWKEQATIDALYKL